MLIEAKGVRETNTSFLALIGFVFTDNWSHEFTTFFLVLKWRRAAAVR